MQFSLRTGVIAMFIAGGVLGFAVWLSLELGVGGNNGLEIGYYGHFNRVHRVLSAMPGVRIISSWQHQDISLEDFGFLIESGGREVYVNFHEHTPEMRERDEDKLRAIIEAMIAAPAVK